MFTVLIAEKEHIDAMQQDNKLFFEPFLENKELAFCYWNPMGQNLQDSVPGLLDAVGCRKDWRAVIINNYTDESAKKRNPFDVVDHSNLDALTLPTQQPQDGETQEKWEATWKEYYHARTTEKRLVYQSALEYPFVRLATWLCFRREDYVYNDVKEKLDANDWALEMLERDGLKPSTTLELLERDQYKCELRMKERIRREFMGESCLNVAHPHEVHCISLRSAENNHFDPDAYWTIHQDSEYSSFAERNMYFDQMRFMVFDMLARSHRNFRTEYIRFLASVLIFASNPVPASAMQARRLYRLEAETDDTPLRMLVTSYDRKLAATYEVIGSEMEKIRNEIPGELTDKAAEALFCTPTDIAVLLDESCDADKVVVDKDYGLFFDSPENEFHKWNRDYQASEKELIYIAKQQSRSLRKSVNQLNSSCEITDVNISRLTPLQVDDIRDYTDAEENDMIASIPPDLADISIYKRRLEKQAEEVKKTISRRMSKKTATTISVICLGLLFVCFLPFLLANSGTFETVITAIVLSASMCGLLAIVLLVSLFLLRSSVTNAIRVYNNTAREITNDIRYSMKRFSKYLSTFCNVRRGHAVQNYAKKNVDVYTQSLRIRKKHQEDIRKRRAQLEEGYGDFFAGASYCDETMCRPYDYDFDQTTEYAYPAPFLAGDCRQIEFINSGNWVTVPSSYIIRIQVRMEEIYEK